MNETIMSTQTPPLLVALGTHAEVADFVAEAAEATGFEALSVPGGDDIGLRVAAAAADVLVLDTATAQRELASVPSSSVPEDAPLVVLLISPDTGEAALARKVIATRGMRIVATVEAPMAEEALRLALAAARQGVAGT